MASAKLAPILSDVIGSVGPDTFSHTRAVLIIKNKSYPGSVHSFTPSQKQIDMRTSFSIPAAHWKELKSTQIKDWCDLAKTIPGYNKFNESYYQAGFNLFCQLQHNMQLIAQNMYDDAPAIPAITELPSFTLNIISNTPLNIQIDFTGHSIGFYTTYLIYATPALSAGRFYVKTFYRLIGLLPSSTSYNFNISNFYSALFSDPASNQKISVKITAIDNLTGFAGHSLLSSAIWNP